MPGHSNPPVMSDGPVVGVVGPADAGVERAVREAGGLPNAGPATVVAAESDAVVAVGEPAVLAVARATPDVPVLPVAAGRGVRSVPRAAVPDAVATLCAGEFTTETHPVVGVRVADRTTARALQDVMLASAEPAQISEYTVSSDGERVARFRADGVVVATPAGSPGYARATGGPVVPPETGVATVVPVSPFSTDIDHWAVPLSDLTLAIERDETDIQLVADDRVVGPVGRDDPVRITPTASVEFAVVPTSRSCFER